MRTDIPRAARVREILRARVAELGLTQQAIADQVGHSQSWVSYQLTGRSEMSVNDLNLWCRILGLDPVTVLQQATNE